MKRKGLILVTIGLTSLLCFGCGNNTSTNESTPAVSNETTEETNNQEEVETTEENEEVDTKEVVETEEAEVPVETEKVYRLKDSISYDSDGNINREEHHEYNEAGERIKSTINGENITYSYEYSNDNVLIKEEALKEDGSIFYTKEYDNDGNEIRYYSCEFLSNYSEYTYTYENGVKSTGGMILYYEDGSISLEDAYVYDEYGNEIRKEEKMYYEDGSEMLTGISNYTYEYDSNNLPIKKTCKSEDESWVDIEEFKYDSKGNMIEDIFKSYDSTGELFSVSRYTYAYDDQNNEIEYIQYNEDDSIGYYNKSEITYDENNNIIKGVNKDENDSVRSSYEAEYIEMELPKSE